jgi:hypothetical protein
VNSRVAAEHTAVEHTAAEDTAVKDIDRGKVVVGLEKSAAAAAGSLRIQISILGARASLRNLVESTPL